MIQGALEADGRIAAKNSVKVRAALRQSIDAEQVFIDYQDTHPYVSDDITQDRARARAWAMPPWLRAAPLVMHQPERWNFCSTVTTSGFWR